VTLTLGTGWSSSTDAVEVTFSVLPAAEVAKTPWSAKADWFASEAAWSAEKAVQSAEMKRRRVRMQDAALRVHSSTREPFNPHQMCRIFTFIDICFEMKLTYLWRFMAFASLPF